MILSILIPAYKAGDTIPATLASVFAEPMVSGWDLEVMVVDDGSPDGDELASIAALYPTVKLLRLEENQGKCKAMNYGIARTAGDAVMILDADDTLVPGWPQALARAVKHWPPECAICFTACQTPDGKSTVSEPDYTGPLSFEDMLADRHSGEYLPMFRGGDLRAAGGYWDPGDWWGCVMLTYLGFAKKKPLWISAEILRVYHIGRAGSVSDSVTQASGAAGVSRCYDYVFEAFGSDYKRIAPLAYRRRRLRHAVFAAIAGEERAMSLWRGAAHWRVPFESVAALLLVLTRGRVGLSFVRLGKHVGFLRRYG